MDKIQIRQNTSTLPIWLRVSSIHHLLANNRTFRYPPTSHMYFIRHYITSTSNTTSLNLSGNECMISCGSRHELFLSVALTQGPLLRNCIKLLSLLPKLEQNTSISSLYFHHTHQIYVRFSNYYGREALNNTTSIITTSEIKVKLSCPCALTEHHVMKAY
jgi:hypothetical protein